MGYSERVEVRDAATDIFTHLENEIGGKGDGWVIENREEGTFGVDFGGCVESSFFFFFELIFTHPHLQENRKRKRNLLPFKEIP